MPFAPSFFDHLEDRLNLAVYDINQEHRMSAQSISGLADVIKQARTALAGVPAVADDIKATTSSVLAKVKKVQDLTGELKAADAELDAAIGQLSNGAPPLENTTNSAPVIPVPSPIPTADNPDAVHDDTGTVIRPVLSA